MSEFRFVDNQAAFILRVRQFHARLQEQLDSALERCGLSLRAKTTAIVQLLYQEGPCSVGQMADKLRYSHQLAIQRLNWLIENGFAESEKDPEDRRRRLVTLTTAGRKEAELLQAFIPCLSASFADLFVETGLNLDDAIRAADAALLDRPLVDRFPDESHRSRS